jgi:hypothetical protein
MRQLNTLDVGAVIVILSVTLLVKARLGGSNNFFFLDIALIALIAAGLFLWFRKEVRNRFELRLMGYRTIQVNQVMMFMLLVSIICLILSFATK